MSKHRKYYAIGLKPSTSTTYPVCLTSNDYDIEYFDSSDSFDVSDASGLILLQGCYERLSHYDGPIYGSGERTNIEYDTNKILKDKIQLINIKKRGGWLCILCDKVVKNLSEYGGGWKDISTSDLSKVIMKEIGLDWNRIGPKTNIVPRYVEFEAYFEKYACAKTAFYLRDVQGTERIIAAEEHSVLALEVDGSTFFLPFLQSEYAKEAKDLTHILIKAIESYRETNRYSIPDWVNEFIFEEEEQLNQELLNLKKSVDAKSQELTCFREYKSIIVGRGDPLKEEIFNILLGYFHLNVSSVEEFKEDIRLLDKDNNTIGVIEVKGTTKGITNEQLNQVDTHRERLELSHGAPGILIINNAISKDSFIDKINAFPAEEQINHAVRNNLLIIRTIDLLYFMRNCEANRPEDRGKMLFEYLNGKCGWLKVVDDKSELLDR